MGQVYWRFVQIRPFRTLFGFIICLVIAFWILDKLTKGKIWKYPDIVSGSVVCVGAIVLIAIVMKVTAALSSNGLSIFEYIEGSWTYIPAVETLCDEEGNRRYSSYDEYRMEYWEKHYSFE